ncbi:MAG: ABC transporter ATP-binding protein [bacterium]
MNLKLRVEDVHKSFDPPEAKNRRYVLQGISLQVAQGEFVSLLGHTGCGKSTLLNLIAGYIRPDKGLILIDGKKIEAPGADRGVVFQEYALFPWYTVLENVAFGPEVRGSDQATSRQLARRYIRLVGLERVENSYPDALSGGMKQRVGIARALANEPSVLLMDEPFGALDALTRETMRRELLRIWLEVRPTVIFVTHGIAEAVALSDRVAVMNLSGGLERVVEIALPRPRDPHSESFLSHVKALERLLMEEIKPLMTAGIPSELADGRIR